MSGKLRVGVIGAGGMGSKVHIPYYHGCGERVEILAVSDLIPEKAEKVAGEYGIPHTFTDYEEMLSKVELDAVSVCTPNKFHAPCTVAALQAGCHVLCEKPPAMNAGEAQKMAEAARRAEKILTYGFHFRHSPEVETLKRFIESGELGDVYAVTARWMRRRGIPGRSFINQDLQGGGPMIDIGVHVLDTAMYLLGYPEPEVVLGSTYQKIGNKPGVGIWGDWDWENFTVEDLARGMICYENGLSLIIEASFAANIGEKEKIELTLMGDEGGADLFPLGIYREKHKTLIDITPAHLPECSHHQLEIERFVDCCLAGKQPVSTPKEGVIIQKTIDAFYASAKEGRAVALDSEFQAEEQQVI